MHVEKTPYEVVWHDATGGYDCMTYSIRVGPIVLDGADYGQRPGEPINALQLERMEADAQMIVEASRARAEGASLCAKTGGETKAAYATTESLRDAVALAALQGFCSQTDASGSWSWLPDMAVAEAWRVADAFIAARETGETD